MNHKLLLMHEVQELDPKLNQHDWQTICALRRTIYAIKNCISIWSGFQTVFISNKLMKKSLVKGFFIFCKTPFWFAVISI
jgi:hypothetical protein